VYKAILSKQVFKDLEKLKRAGLAAKAKELTDIVEADPSTAAIRKIER